ncbi:unnamed protein product [Triticum turgidum subsp. durum]|uniref:F-box domain-containing protein n=1 Tax=Triticum turgidum subsp. durum TaxID=4567 RepID=A0A9R0TRM1_TRITD|nr:unnamed protein product [Triticum turgidum subsp. durum]
MDLPDELVVDILGRLRPRDVAVCRCVRKDWRTAIDLHGLLLLPVGPVRGLFVNYIYKWRNGFFSRVAPAQGSPSIDGGLHFLPGRPTNYRGVLDHSNGLLLYENALEMHVCNPATRRWAALPPPRVPPICLRQPLYRRRMYLLFDPTRTLHYDVLFLPDAPKKPNYVGTTLPEDQPGSSSSETHYEHEYNTTSSMEWPPYLYPVQIYSSITGQWADRTFVREGNVTGTMMDVWSDPTPPTSGFNAVRRHGVHWRGALYVHCRGFFVMRLSLVEENYRVIKTPRLHVAEYNEEDDDAKTFGYLGKSNNRVYYTAIRGYQFQVWILREASGLHQAPEWEVKHQANLKLAFVRHYNKHKIGENSATWVLNPRDKVSEDRKEHEWDSSDDSEDNVADMEEEEINNLEGYKKHYHYYGLDLLGYHPHKEIALLGNSFKGFAYYLDNSKLEYLGSLFPSFSLDIRPRAPMFESFIYTPCMDDLLPAHNDI